MLERISISTVGKKGSLLPPVYLEGCVHGADAQLEADLKEHQQLIRELNEDWEATLKVASNKKLSDILLDKELVDRMAYDELLADMENMVEITPIQASALLVALDWYLDANYTNPNKDTEIHKILKSIAGRDEKNGD